MSMVERGFFIAVEGIDGSGKTTQAHLLAGWIFDQYRKSDSVVLTREPSATKFTKEIHETLNASRADAASVPKDRILELFILDREEHVDKVIAPSIHAGRIVVCDRYKYSTIAYQSAQGILSSELVSKNAGFPIPDVVLVFNADPETCVKRMASSRKNLDAFEKQSFLEKVKKQYVNLPRLLPNEKFIFIDANQSIEKTHQDAIAAVKSYLDAWSK
ncbi:MAG: dTMP kinase [archaeon]